MNQQKEIFCKCLNTDLFLSEWKKSNVLPLSNKGDKQCLKYQRPVSLLPVYFFNEISLTSPKQFRFKPEYLCINQLTSITHEPYESSDADLEVKRVFLDISKAFNKVWHERGLFKKV